MTDSTDIPPKPQLERLVDLTVLGPTDQELGTCWLYIGTTTPYGSMPDWNPDHLTVVTHAENMAVGHHATKTHCKHGHPLSGSNLRIGPNGARVCRACNAAHQRAFRERHRDS